jgi:hypothetical protein
MPAEESTPFERRALSPEEVGARVSAILEAAERDARAVIDAAHREAVPPTGELTLERVAAELDALSGRVAALESALGAAPRATASPSTVAEPPSTVAEPPSAVAPPHRTAARPPSVAAQPPQAADPRRVAEADAVDPTPAARVRAIELALSGYPRAAIARELAAVMSPQSVDSLLDEVLAP